MGANALNRSLQPKAGLMVLLMLLMTVPLIPTSAAADIGDASKLQAQDIAATFDPVSETTTITWRNIEPFSGSNVANLQNAEYTVYRHSEPITPGTLVAAIPFANVTACVAIQSVECLAPTHPGHSASFTAQTKDAVHRQKKGWRVSLLDDRHCDGPAPRGPFPR